MLVLRLLSLTDWYNRFHTKGISSSSIMLPLVSCGYEESLGGLDYFVTCLSGILLNMLVWLHINNVNDDFSF